MTYLTIPLSDSGRIHPCRTRFDGAKNESSPENIVLNHTGLGPVPAMDLRPTCHLMHRGAEIALGWGSLTGKPYPVFQLAGCPQKRDLRFFQLVIGVAQADEPFAGLFARVLDVVERRAPCIQPDLQCLQIG